MMKCDVDWEKVLREVGDNPPRGWIAAVARKYDIPAVNISVRRLRAGIRRTKPLARKHPGPRRLPDIGVQLYGPDAREIREFCQRHGFHMSTIVRELLAAWFAKMRKKLEA